MVAEIGPNGNINLANYGVFMTKIGSAKLITNYWKNSFILPLPSEKIQQLIPPKVLCANFTQQMVKLTFLSESVDVKGEALKSAWMIGPHDTKEEAWGKHISNSAILFGNHT